MKFETATTAGRQLWQDIVAADRANSPEAYKECGHRRCPCELQP